MRILKFLKMFLPYGMVRLFQKIKEQPEIQRTANFLIEKNNALFSQQEALKNLIYQIKTELEVFSVRSAHVDKFLIESILPNSSENLGQKIFIQKKYGQNDVQIPVVYITDEKYLEPTVISVSSLFRHAASNTFYKVIIFYTGIESEKLNFYKKKLPFVDFRILCRDHVDLAQKHLYVSSAALFKFELPNLLSEYDKVLYLDSDVFVADDLQALFQTDITKKYAAVVKDVCAIQTGYSEEMGLASYFNSGVMLLNLKKMREGNLSELLFLEKKNDPYKRFMDQDALNIVFRDNVVYLSPTWNMMLNNLLLQGSPLEKIAEEYSISVLELIRIMNTPSISHLSNIKKPWFASDAIGIDIWLRERNFFYGKNAN